MAAGLLTAWTLAGALEGMLYGIAPTDTATAVLTTAMLAVAGLAATLIPSLRATRIDPVAILRRG